MSTYNESNPSHWQSLVQLFNSGKVAAIKQSTEPTKFKQALLLVNTAGQFLNSEPCSVQRWYYEENAAMTNQTCKMCYKDLQAGYQDLISRKAVSQIMSQLVVSGFLMKIFVTKLFQKVLPKMF